MVRKPVVAGQFYPAAPAQLKEIIQGMVNAKARKEDVIGLIAPHAGYIYSGPVAGAAFSRIKFGDTFIILGPNHTGRGQPASIMSQGRWETPLGAVDIDSELAGKLLAASPELAEDALAHEHEHSIEVQLPFLQYFKPDVKIVPIILAQQEPAAYKAIGQAIASVAAEAHRKIVILASSDMTHYESQESARKKDTSAIEAILDLDEDELLQRIEAQNISMCGYAPAVALIAAAKELGATEAELVKYQTSGDVSGDKSSVVGYAGIIIKGVILHPLVRLAKDTVEAYVTRGKIIRPPKLTPEMKQKAGVFVSIHKKGELRGCIGTYESAYGNVAEEIIGNAISAATRDPRFPPVSPGELKDLDYKVDVLTRPEPVSGKEELDPKKYGVIAQCGWRRGLLLPDLEGVETAEQQVEICCLKADIQPGEPVKLYRFSVQRYA